MTFAHTHCRCTHSLKSGGYIYLDASRLAIYQPLFTSPWGDSCILFPTLILIITSKQIICFSNLDLGMLLRLWYTLLSSNCTSTSKALSSNFLSSFKSLEPFEKQRSLQYVTEITHNLLWKTLSIDSYNNNYYATWLCNVPGNMKLFMNQLS